MFTYCSLVSAFLSKVRCHFNEIRQKGFKKKKRERDIKECVCPVVLAKTGVHPKICKKNCPVSFEISEPVRQKQQKRKSLSQDPADKFYISSRSKEKKNN